MRQESEKLECSLETRNEKKTLYTLEGLASGHMERVGGKSKHVCLHVQKTVHAS